MARRVPVEDAVKQAKGEDILDRFVSSESEKGQEPEKPSEPGDNAPEGQSRSSTISSPPNKVTLYLSDETLVTLEEIKLKRLKEEGKRTSRSALVMEAVDLLKPGEG